MPPDAPSGRPRRPDPDISAEQDPINTIDLPALHRKSQRIMAELIAALPAYYRNRVADATLDFDAGAINAYASCRMHGPTVTLTDELLHVMAQLARARALEEEFDVDATRVYMRWMAEHQTSDGALAVPPEGRDWIARRLDRQKLTRQHQIFDEGIAWVIGHELAHHYLNHLSCDGDGGVIVDIHHATEMIIPAFHQPDELAADSAGIANTLAAGRQRKGYAWTQHGALLLLEFLRIVDDTNALPLERTHPPAIVRIPILKGATATWYIGNGAIPPAIPYPKV